ncbi:MAG TPA: hypothetical protein VLA79_11930 [Polyangia bacterium]|jgi:hypothetical protein|nr:hypothetical protein [Polyangia bacterium]
MRRISFRLRSVLVASFFAGLAGIACTEGIGGRCVQNSDCSSGVCSSNGQLLTAEGGRCVAPGTTIVPPAGTGGTAGDGAAGSGAAGIGGTAGTAGAAGVGGAAGSTGAAGAAGASATGGHGGAAGGSGGGNDGGTADATADH